MREHWVRERTAIMNRIRALLSEFGLVIPVGRSSLMKLVPLMLEDANNELPQLQRRCCMILSASQRSQSAYRRY